MYAQTNATDSTAYSAAARLEPHQTKPAFFASSGSGRAEFTASEPALLKTIDDSAQADGRFYYTGTAWDVPSMFRLEIGVRVLRSEGNPCATSVQVPLECREKEADRTPLKLGGLGEGHQDFGGGVRQIAIGFQTNQQDRSQDRVQLIDATTGKILATRNLSLDVMRTYVLEILPGKPGPEIRLSWEGEKEPMTVELQTLEPGARTKFGLLFGHPSGTGQAEAHWQRVALSPGLTPSAPPAAVGPPAAAGPVRLGVHRGLALDDTLWEKRDGMRLVQGKFEKSAGNPVVRREHPWEANRCELFGSCVRDDKTGRLQLFYSAMSTVFYDHKMAYAESSDNGLTWRKPLLDVYKHEGKPTNIVYPGRYIVEGPSVFLDPHDPDPARRYKVVMNERPIRDSDPVHRQKSRGRAGLDVGWSADGVHWTMSPKNPVGLPGFNSDTGQCAFWDGQNRRYVAYVRLRSATGRSIGIIESRDFETWTEPRLIFAPSDEDRAKSWQFYGLSATPYQGRYVGLVWIFPATAASASAADDTPVTWPELAFSLDGEHWRRIARGEPIMPLGPEGSFDHRQIRTASSLVVLEDRILLLYSGSPDPHVKEHKYDIGLATLRLDGFASLDAGGAQGTVVTKPLQFDSGELRINAIAQPGGYIKAEILDGGGKSLAGYELSACQPFSGDSLKGKIAWKTASAIPATPPEGLRIRFVLKNASLYSFGVTGGGRTGSAGER